MTTFSQSIDRPTTLPAEDAAGAHAQTRPKGDWRFALLGGLATPRARRIYTSAEFRSFVELYKPGASSSTALAAAESMVSAGALKRVSTGIYLNRRATPPAELAETAAHIRNGAVISLHSVLGECGFLNNPSGLVTAVVPSTLTARPRLGELTTSGGDRFRFYGLAQRFFPETSQDRREMLQQGRHCEMFRPEAALLHWLHLASIKRSSLTQPPVDVDLDSLDLHLLDKLSARWELGDHLDAWISAARQSNFGEQPDSLLRESEKSSEDAGEHASQARARMFSRRRVV